MSDILLLQLDSVPVVARTQYLPLFSRLGAYRSGLLDEMAWGRRAEWFETWSHEASVVPHELEPLLRWRRAAAAGGDTWGHLVDVANRESAYVAEVLAEVRESGPLQAGELSDPRPVDRGSAGWGSSSLGSVALDWLFRIGEVGILRTSDFRKRFDVLDRIVPADVLALPTPDPDDARRTLLVRSAVALGIGTVADLADYFRMRVTEARPLVAELVETGDLVEVGVEGTNARWFADPAVLGRRRQAASPGVLLSPFDPLVWRRARCEALFETEVKLEIYTPAAKRRWGYYVLPFIMDDRIAARVDLRFDRDRGALRVLATHGEPSIERERTADRLSIELGELASFLGAERVEVEDSGDLAPELSRVTR